MAVIIAAWTLVALAWTPPTILIQTPARGVSGAAPGAPDASTALRVFLYVLMGFVPWMAITPLLLRIGRRFPLSEGGLLPPLAVHVAVGAVVVPAATWVGTLLAVLAVHHGHLQAGDPRRILSAATITAFYTVPTYVAVAAVAQSLAFFRRYRQRERLLARAQLQALQARINPHFLFNTLNAISALGYRDPARADAAITLLAELMRDSLRERPQQIALKEEIAFVRSYLDLYALLLGDALRLSFDISGRAWGASVPTMLLQPLIENAIIHGIARRPEGGLLTVRAYVEATRLALSVSNDAPAAGLSAGGSGIGLANTRERLRALYGDRHLLAMRRGADTVTIEISIPFSEPK